MMKSLKLTQDNKQCEIFINDEDSENQGLFKLLGAAFTGDQRYLEELFATNEFTPELIARACFTAAANGKDTFVDTFLRAGVEVDVEDPEGKTMLIYASQYNNSRTLKILIDNGANPNVANGTPPATALFWCVAARPGAGLNSDQVDSFKMSQIESVKVLLDAEGINVNVEGEYNPLAAAILNENVEAIKMLLSAGADSKLALASTIIKDKKQAKKILKEAGV